MRKTEFAYSTELIPHCYFSQMQTLRRHLKNYLFPLKFVMFKLCIEIFV